MNEPTGILLTEPDAARLERSIIDPQVVTMNSVVVLEDLPSSRRLTVTLAYPGESDPQRQRISVLSAFGRALIGAHVGDVISTGAGSDESGKYLVAELRYQPEAAGRFDL